MGLLRLSVAGPPLGGFPGAPGIPCPPSPVPGSLEAPRPGPADSPASGELSPSPRAVVRELGGAASIALPANSALSTYLLNKEVNSTFKNSTNITLVQQQGLETALS